MAGLTADGVRCDWLDTSHAFHSALLDPILDEFESYAQPFDSIAPQRILIDNRTGAALGRSVKLDGAYWRRHARQPVEFAKSVRTLAELNCKVLLEIGPQPVLTAAALRAWPDPATFSANCGASAGAEKALVLERRAGSPLPAPEPERSTACWRPAICPPAALEHASSRSRDDPVHDPAETALVRVHQIARRQLVDIWLAVVGQDRGQLREIGISLDQMMPRLPVIGKLGRSGLVMSRLIPLLKSRPRRVLPSSGFPSRSQYGLPAKSRLQSKLYCPGPATASNGISGRSAPAATACRTRRRFRSAACSDTRPTPINRNPSVAQTTEAHNNNPMSNRNQPAIRTVHISRRKSQP